MAQKSAERPEQGLSGYGAIQRSRRPARGLRRRQSAWSRRPLGDGVGLHERLRAEPAVQRCYVGWWRTRPTHSQCLHGRRPRQREDFKSFRRDTPESRSTWCQLTPVISPSKCLRLHPRLAHGQRHCHRLAESAGRQHDRRARRRYSLTDESLTHYVREYSSYFSTPMDGRTWLIPSEAASSKWSQSILNQTMRNMRNSL